ncbi:MAG: hypothetical protein LLF92_07295 [Planctomycetaceae bacterium]|nr:hypothetical protein [Planctomycetaceae bacterium]
MVDDSLIKPIDGQNVMSIKSAKDKDINDKRKRQNNGQTQQHTEPKISDDLDDSEVEKSNHNKGEHWIDYCA